MCAVERARARRREKEKQLSASREALLSGSEDLTLTEVIVQPDSWSAELRSCSRLYQPVPAGDVSHDTPDMPMEGLAEVSSLPLAMNSTVTVIRYRLLYCVC